MWRLNWTFLFLSALGLGVLILGPWLTISALGLGLTMAGLMETMDNPRDE